MMTYRAAGVAIPRTSQAQWAAGPRVPPGQEQPGDLVFIAGSDGTTATRATWASTSATAWSSRPPIQEQTSI
jgi:cell wall-associated NlpC family hydrolase